MGELIIPQHIKQIVKNKQVLNEDSLKKMISKNVKILDNINYNRRIDTPEFFNRLNINNDKLLIKKINHKKDIEFMNFKYTQRPNEFQKYYAKILETVKNQELEQEGKATLESIKDSEFNFMTGDFGLAMAEMFKKATTLFKKQ